MKKMMLSLFALALMFSFAAFAQSDSSMSSDKSSDKMAAPKLENLHGWVSDEKCGAKDANNAECAKKCVDGGSAIVFVTDKTHKVYTVKNPETLTDHVGHHVKVNAHVYPDGSIHVMKVSMMGGKKAA